MARYVFGEKPGVVYAVPDEKKELVELSEEMIDQGQVNAPLTRNVVQVQPIVITVPSETQGKRRSKQDDAPPRQRAIAPRLMDIATLAEDYFDGATPHYVEEQIDSGRLPAIRLGRTPKVDVKDADKFVDEEKQRQAENPPAPLGFAHKNGKPKPKRD